MSRTVAVLFALLLAAPIVLAQPADTAANAALRQQIERRFDVLPLHEGLALRPKSHASGIRSIELAGGTISIDGQPATGAELRDRLGADADPVLRLSYLDPAAQRALFESPRAREPEAGTATPPERTENEIRQEARERAREMIRGHRSRTSDARVRIGGSITVGPDETVSDDVVCIGGSATIDGQVIGNVVVIGGPVTLGPTAEVSGDVTSVGGTIHRDPGARIGGRINEIAVGAIDLRGLRGIPFGAFAWRPTMWHGVALVGTLMRLAVLCIFASIVVLFARRHVERIGDVAAAEPVKAGLIGLLAELLFFPLLVICTIVLVVTIIGIPLLVLIPFALLAAAVIALVGFTSVAWRIGRAVSERFGWRADNPYGVAVVGVAIVIAPVLLARLLGLGGALLFPITLPLVALGVVFEYLVWTVGIGALALVRFERPRTAVPAAATPATPAA